MSFLITVAVPKPNDFQANVDDMKQAGMRYVPERRCWVGEIAADVYEDVLTVVGSFVADSVAGWSNEDYVRQIDRCADFKLVGR